LEALGGVPQTLRTNSLSAAYKNLKQQEDLTFRFDALCQHYGCKPTRNNLPHLRPAAASGAPARMRDGIGAPLVRTCQVL
jgi:hypothetical protein